MSNVGEGKVVSFNYTLKDDQGNLLDASETEPLEYLHGHNNIIPGLEKAMNGMTIGQKAQVTVQPDEAYGQPSPELQFAISREQFGDGPVPQPGMFLQLQAQNGFNFNARVVGLDQQMVYLDANHPLAGLVLYYDIEVIAIRDATSEEVEHGHAHGPGAYGHQH